LDPELQALIAEDLSRPYSGALAVTRVDFFYSRHSLGPSATAYYFFGDEALARSVLTEEEIDAASVWHGAYVFAGGFVPSRGLASRDASPTPTGPAGIQPSEMSGPRGVPGGLGP
jgi:hypothetical protein